AVRDAPRRRVLHGSEHPWGAHHDRRLTPHTHPRAGSKTHPASRFLTILPRHHDPRQEPSLLLTKNIGTPPRLVEPRTHRVAQRDLEDREIAEEGHGQLAIPQVELSRTIRITVSSCEVRPHPRRSDRAVQSCSVTS